MARRFIQIKRGQQYQNIVEAAATDAAADVELAINLATLGSGLKELEIEQLMRMLRRYLREHKYPLA